ncbi:MAG: molybdate ABC transporter substrate-binding protein [Bacillota bacterium]|nr:molybdate ABC transporter substrate-binding protein [Bacillota bacterium]
MKKGFIGFIIISLVAGFLLISGCSSNSDADQNSINICGSESEYLRVYSGAGLSKPMDDIGAAFKQKYGVKIEFVYGGSGQNLAQLELAGDGDVWTPGSMADCLTAEEKGLIENKKEIVYHIPVIAVPKGNPANITSLEDLTNDGVKIVLGDGQSCAIGKVTNKLFKENDLTERIVVNTVAQTATVNELQVYLELKQADATILWEDQTVNNDKIEKIEIDRDINQIKTVPVAVLKSTEKMELAQQFADFVASNEGLQIFTGYGFEPIDQ